MLAFLQRGPRAMAELARAGFSPAGVGHVIEQLACNGYAIEVVNDLVILCGEW
jgi:hypothetical protein